MSPARAHGIIRASRSAIAARLEEDGEPDESDEIPRPKKNAPWWVELIEKADPDNKREVIRGIAKDLPDSIAGLVIINDERKTLEED